MILNLGLCTVDTMKKESLFQTCISRLDAILISKGSLGIPEEALHVQDARYFDQEDMWFGKAMQFVNETRAIFDIRNNQPLQLFESARHTRLDQVVQRHMLDWMEIDQLRMDRILVDTIKDVEFQHCNRDFKQLFIALVMASITRALASHDIHHNFIRYNHGWQTFKHYIQSEKILSKLLSFTENFVYNTRNPRGQGQISSRMSADEANAVIKDYMAFLGPALLPDDIEWLTCNSLTQREQARFRDAMASSS